MTRDICHLLLLSALILPINAQNSPRKISLEVRVRNSVTQAPLAGVNVTAGREDGSVVSGRTDSAGLFQGAVNAPGHYLLAVSRTGYRMTGGGLLGKSIDLQAGAPNQITIDLLPLGVITGRVVDQYGDPVSHAIVRTEVMMGDTHHGGDFESTAVATTDDRGEYRIHDVESGKHYIAVEYSNREDQQATARFGFHFPDMGGFTIYPGVPSIGQALEVESAAGSTVRLNDVTLRIREPLVISGRITPPLPANSVPPINLERVNRLALSTSAQIQGNTPKPDGTFHLNVYPGEYILTAGDPKTGKSSKPLPITVADRDISGLVLDLNQSYVIHGRVVLDTQAKPIDLSKLDLVVGEPVKLDRSGVFDAKLLGDKSLYFLHQLPEGWYVKSVQVGGQQITGHKFELQPGATDMTILLSPHGAQVNVHPTGKGSDSLDQIAVLLPESGPVNPSNFDSLPMSHSDRNGGGPLLIQGIPPGTYRAFLVDTSSFMLLLNPTILDKYRASTPVLTLRESDRKELTLPLLKIELE